MLVLALSRAKSRTMMRAWSCGRTRNSWRAPETSGGALDGASREHLHLPNTLRPGLVERFAARARLMTGSEVLICVNKRALLARKRAHRRKKNRTNGAFIKY
jgi:hypothetical protein